MSTTMPSAVRSSQRALEESKLAISHSFPRMIVSWPWFLLISVNLMIASSITEVRRPMMMMRDAAAAMKALHMANPMPSPPPVTSMVLPA